MQYICKISISCFTGKRNQFQTLAQHFQKCHPHIYSKVGTGIKPELNTPAVIKSSLNLSREEKKISFGLWANLIAVAGVPQNLGEHPAMRQFFSYHGITLGYHHVTVKKYQHYLREGYLKDVSLKIQKIIEFCALPNFSIIHDCWSRGNTQLLGSMLTYICPYEVEMRQIPLGLLEIKGNATAEVIKDTQESLLERVGLKKDQIFFSGNDNARVAIKASVLLSGKHSDGFSHLSHLVVKDQISLLLDPEASQKKNILNNNNSSSSSSSSSPVLTTNTTTTTESSTKKGKIKKRIYIHPEINGLIERTSMISNHFNRSSLAERKLREFQTMKQFETTLVPISFCPTRWTELYSMLLRQQQLFKMEFCEFWKNYQSTCPLPLTPLSTDEHNLEILVSILHPINKYTLLTEKSDLSYAEAYVAGLKLLHELSAQEMCLIGEDGFAKVTDDGEFKTFNISTVSEFFRSFRNGLITSLKNRILVRAKEQELLLSIWLDPKHRRIINYMARSRDSTCNEIAATVEKDLESTSTDTEINRRMDVVEAELKKRASASQTVVSAAAAPEVKRVKPKQIFDDDLALAQVPPSSSNSKDNELKQCKDAILGSKDSDLLFWKTNRNNFPRIFQIFIQSRGHRPSTSRLESVFSSAGALVPDIRESILNEQLDTLLILNLAELTERQITDYVKSVPDPGRQAIEEGEEE
jgi:hypothetical protein